MRGRCGPQPVDLFSKIRVTRRAAPSERAARWTFFEGSNMPRHLDCHQLSDSELDELGVMQVDQCRLSGTECLVLRLLRRFCLNHVHPETMSWRLALNDAIGSLGAESGPSLALAVSDFLDAIRSERVEPFNFVDPNCAQCARRIFPAEWAMMVILRGLREREHQLVEAALGGLTQMDYGASRRAALGLSRLMERIEPETLEAAEPRAGTTFH